MSPEPTGVPDSATQVAMPSAAPMWRNMVSPAIPVARRSGRHCQHRGGGEGRQDQAHTGAPDQHPGPILSDVVRLAGRPPSLSQRVPLMHPQQAEQPEVQEPVRKLGAVRTGGRIEITRMRKRGPSGSNRSAPHAPPGAMPMRVLGYAELSCAAAGRLTQKPTASRPRACSCLEGAVLHMGRIEPFCCPKSRIAIVRRRGCSGIRRQVTCGA